MALLYSNDAQFEYREVNRHWDPASEKYAGADCLLTAMNRGWKSSDTAFVEEFWLAGSRLVTVFHLELVRGDDKMMMPVLSNPYMRRVLRRLQPRLVPIQERDLLLRRQASNGSHA